MLMEDLFCFSNLLSCDNWTNQPSLDDVLEAKEHSLIKLATSALKVGVDMSSVWWVLIMVSYLE